MTDPKHPTRQLTLFTPQPFEMLNVLLMRLFLPGQFHDGRLALMLHLAVTVQRS
ncbi:MAG TPA: hypothetical protein VEI50_12355 [Nitrospiraceae bacterium]|nr:hypothetical protein [Nitrospiraceae bacterium]